MEIIPDEIAETIVVIDDETRYAEGYLLHSFARPIGLHLESDETAVEISYSIDEARALHEALGHLIWLADHREG